MTMLEKFIISSVSKELNELNFKISAFNNKPLPCLVLLSNYVFKEQPVKILPNGDIQGGFSNFKARLDSRLYNKIFHTLVGIFQFLTFRLQA